MTREASKHVQLSENFTLFELLQSNKADKHEVTEQYDVAPEEIEKLRQLVLHTLQPLRDHIGRPLKVSSGYRSPRVNKLVGGSYRSDHMYFRAVDIQLVIDGKTDNKAVFRAVLDLGLPFKQMIWEFGTDKEPKWVHLAWDINGGNPSDNILKALSAGGKVSYKRMQPRKPREGWVYGKYIKLRSEVFPESSDRPNLWAVDGLPLKTKVIAIGTAESGLKIRQKPIYGNPIDVLDYDEEVTVLEINDDEWIKIKIEDE